MHRAGLPRIRGPAFGGQSGHRLLGRRGCVGVFGVIVIGVIVTRVIIIGVIVTVVVFTVVIVIRVIVTVVIGSRSLHCGWRRRSLATRTTR